jgi:hypothetical protein
VGYHNPDEYFQITEFASYKLGITPAANLAWEFNAGIRPALQPAMIYGLCKLTNLSNPVMVSFLLRLVSALAGWGVTALFVLVCLKQVRSDEMKKMILYLSVFFGSCRIFIPGLVPRIGRVFFSLQGFLSSCLHIGKRMQSKAGERWGEEKHFCADFRLPHFHTCFAEF